MNLDGWLTLLENGMDMDISVNTPQINFKDVLSLIPGIYQNNFDALQASGNLDIKAEAKGLMVGESLPKFAIGFNVNNGMVSYEGMPQKIEQIRLLFKIPVAMPIKRLSMSKISVSKWQEILLR